MAPKINNNNNLFLHKHRGVSNLDQKDTINLLFIKSQNLKIMTKVKIKKKNLFAFFTEQINKLRANGKLGTARNYQRTLNSFYKFRNGTDLLLSQCTEELIREYDAWIQSREVSRNTISFYMRNFRSVYNMAANLHHAQQTNPFDKVYTGVDRTRKRAIDEQAILQLYELELKEFSPLALARDIFIFSYATRGMSFIDIAYLSKQNIVNGTITYARRKTGQTLIIEMEPCMEKIIQRYQHKQGDLPYIFPFIHSTNPVIAYTQYQTALGYYNRLLKKLGKLIHLDVPLSSYTSRHTWATVARKHNTQISVISAGMGHTSEKTTQIYLASIDQSVVDQANHNLLRLLNK